MTRHFRQYKSTAIVQAINNARNHTGWRDATAVTDLAAQDLAGIQADDAALEDARHQVSEAMGMDHAAQRAVERS